MWSFSEDARRALNGPLHVVPRNDLVDHVLDREDCACGPRVQGEVREDGSMTFVVVHHSLDGREQSE